MKQLNKLRDSLRAYYDTQQLPYYQMDWEQASAYIDAQRKTRKLRSLLLIFSTLLFLSGTFLFYFSNPSKGSSNLGPFPALAQTKLISETRSSSAKDQEIRSQKKNLAGPAAQQRSTQQKKDGYCSKDSFGRNPSGQ